MSTIMPEDSKYHNRWMIDEEIANAIKDGNGNAIGTYTNLNIITTTTWTFNHQGDHLIGDLVAVTILVKKKIAINKRKSMKFYYITHSSNEDTLSDSRCDLWTDVYNS